MSPSPERCYIPRVPFTLPTNIQLGWKDLQGTNIQLGRKDLQGTITLACYKNL
jgi:hypothetical protein